MHSGQSGAVAMKTSGEGAAKGLFFRRFLIHPGRVASLFPSSQALSRMIAGQVRRTDDEYVIELGGRHRIRHARHPLFRSAG